MVRIATWNLENLFLPGDASGAPDDRAAYDAKLDGLAGVIADLQPDVLAVQEVGDPAALADLSGRLDGDWETALADPDSRGIRVGFLSRPDLTGVEQVRDFPDGIGPVQVDDDRTTINALGRPALAGAGAGRRSYARPALGAPEVQAAHLPRRPVQSPRRGRAGTLRGLRPAPARRRVGRRPGVRHRVARGGTRTWWWRATSTTSRRRRPPRSCSARRVRRSAPAASTSRTRATRCDCGTRPASSTPSSAGHASTVAARS